MGLPTAPAAAAEPAEPIPERLEYFRVERVLGEGGMGRVYAAEDTRLRRPVAVKTLKRELARQPEAVQRFLREARAAAALEHDHVVPVHYVGESDGVPFLVMPLLRGLPLDAFLKRIGGRLDPAAAARIAGQVAAGLAAAHRLGLVHRDIKPGNVWLEGEPAALASHGRVRILDFGLAKSAASAETLTAHGGIVGTPAYMAPEQARGLAADGRADLFSLGCVLYEMLTGARPFVGEGVMAVLTSLAVHTPPAPRALAPACPAGLSDLVMRLLEKEPALRPASAEAVAGALLGGLANPPPVLPAEPVEPWDGIDDPTEVLPRPAARRRRALPLAAAGLALLAGGGLLLLRTGDRAAGVPESEPAARAEAAPRPAPAPATRPPAAGPDRRAAEYVLSLGGRVRVSDNRRDFGSAADLPRGDFRLTLAELRSNARVTDAGLAAFRDCSALGVLILTDTPVTDAGLAHFRGCKDLAYIDLWKVRVTDAGVAHFRDCAGLSTLNLADTAVTDAGLAHLRACRSLSHLDLWNTQVSDAGLAHLRDCRGLSRLVLGKTAVSDAGLAHFRDCARLTYLDLSGTWVTDAGLELVARSFPRLEELRLADARVTRRGLDAIRAALPGCHIERQARPGG